VDEKDPEGEPADAGAPGKTTINGSGSSSFKSVMFGVVCAADG